MKPRSLTKEDGGSEAGRRDAHVKCERALRTWTKRQRADKISEKQNLPKPVNQACERHICRKLFCRLTPELSRPVAGRRTRASVAQSARLTPRHGVGLNELLGGWDADGDEDQADLPKAEVGEHERAPQTLSWTCQK